jgi:putative resolvase
MIYRLAQAAEYLGISRRHLQSLLYSGKVKSSFKTTGGHHRFRKSDLDNSLGIKDEADNKSNIIYTRVSTASQSDDLLRQKLHLINYCNNNQLTPYIIIDDIASGLNETRKGLTKLLKLVSNKEVSTVVITYKERLARFGYHYIESFLNTFGVSIIVTEADEQKTDNEELVDDILAIMTSFSARIYGHRSHKYSKLQKLVNNLDK